MVLFQKKSDLINLLDNCRKQNMEIDIILLCETIYYLLLCVLFTIPNYNLILRPHIYKKGGGIAILVNRKIKYLTQEDLILTENRNFESVFIEIIFKIQKNIIMGSLYRPPNTSETEFLISYNELINKFKLESKKEVVLSLDHNLDLLKCHIHKSGEKFLK